MKKVFFETHPTLRMAFLGVCFVAAVAVGVALFGSDRVADWVEGAAASAGFDITEGEQE